MATEWYEPTRVLVFNPTKRLIGIFQSVQAASFVLGVSVQSVSYACSGHRITCKDHYLRRLEKDILVTMDDFGVLKVNEYDELCGYTDRVYLDKKKTRKGLKSKQKLNQTNKNLKQDED